MKDIYECSEQVVLREFDRPIPRQVSLEDLGFPVPDLLKDIEVRISSVTAQNILN